MNDRQMAFVVDALERRQRWMKSVETVEVNNSLLARGGLRDSDARPLRVKGLGFERDSGVEAVHPAPFENHHHHLTSRPFLSLCGADKKCRGKAQSQKA